MYRQTQIKNKFPLEGVAMTAARTQRIAALEVQLASSRARRSQLLGKNEDYQSGGDSTPLVGCDGQMISSLDLMPSSVWEKLAGGGNRQHSPLAEGDAQGRIERSDSPSHLYTAAQLRFETDSAPSSRGNLGRLKGRWEHKGDLDMGASGLAALRAELQMRTKHVSELQAKLAEATCKAEHAGNEALKEKANQMKLSSEAAQRDREVATLVSAAAQEKQHTEGYKDQAVQLQRQCDWHETTLRTLRVEMHQKSLQFDRIHDQSMRKHSEGEMESKRELLQSRDELLTNNSEIVELKSALRKKEADFVQQLQTKEDALQELRQQRQSLTDSLTQCKTHHGEQQLQEHKLKREQELKLEALNANYDKAKSDYHHQVDTLTREHQHRLERAKNESQLKIDTHNSDHLRKLEKNKHEYKLMIDKMQQDMTILSTHNHDLVKQLAATGVSLSVCLLWQ